MNELDTLYQQNFKSNRQQSFPEVTLTLQHIDKLLEINTNNIPPVKTKINLYADHMLNGRWLYNGDTIRVSKEGVLLDGQNRLLAAQKAKMLLTCDLLVGLDEEVFNTIDQGRVRQKGHLLARDIGDISSNDAKMISTAVTRVLKYSAELSQVTSNGADGKFASKFSADKVINYVNQHPEILDQYETVKKEFHYRSNLPRPTILYLYHIGARYDADYTMKFLKKAVSGVGLKEGETLFFYHQILNELKSKSLTWSQAEQEKTLMKVWSRVADKGLEAIKNKGSIKCKKGEEYVQFIRPTELATTQMHNS